MRKNLGEKDEGMLKGKVLFHTVVHGCSVPGSRRLEIFGVGIVMGKIGAKWKQSEALSGASIFTASEWSGNGWFALIVMRLFGEMISAILRILCR